MFSKNFKWIKIKLSMEPRYQFHDPPGHSEAKGKQQGGWGIKYLSWVNTSSKSTSVDIRKICKNYLINLFLWIEIKSIIYS